MVSLHFGNRVTNYISYVQNLEKIPEKHGLTLISNCLAKELQRISFNAHVHACSSIYTDEE